MASAGLPADGSTAAASPLVDAGRASLEQQQQQSNGTPASGIPPSAIDAMSRMSLESAGRPSMDSLSEFRALPATGNGGTPKLVNGTPAAAGYHGENGEGTSSSQSEQLLMEELERVRSERNAFEGQYKGLLGKLTSMRTTLGDKLKQDADELDRRAQEIEELRASNEDLGEAVETLKNELISSNEDSERAHSELEQLRLRAFDSQQQTAEEAAGRETALRDAQEDLEKARMEKEEWENDAMRERVQREEVQMRLERLELELATAKTEREVLREERDREAESAANLHSVLEEFQAARDREMKSTFASLQAQLKEANSSLEEHKRRASLAEAQLGASQNDTEKVLQLTKEMKDKNAVIGKLRHEAVILNEHLTEAMRRLKKDSNENSVDRRLVTNVLISFLNTPRQDTKRFEMLKILSTILGWTDEQREKVGLQKQTGLSAPGVTHTTARSGRGHARSGKGKSAEDDLGENETFSSLWIEFLLRESQGQIPPSGSDPSTSDLPPLPPLSPTHGSLSLSPPAGRFNLSDLPPLTSPPILGSSRRPSITSSAGGRRPSLTSGRSSNGPPSSSGVMSPPPGKINE